MSAFAASDEGYFSAGNPLWKSDAVSEESTSLLSAMSNVAGGTMEGASNMFGAAKEMMDNPISKEAWMLFGLLMVGGSVLMTMAFAFLPVIIFAPAKFANLFTFGSLCWFAAFCTLKGVSAFFSHLMVADKRPYTLAYGVSVVGTFWAIDYSYLLTLVFAVVQMIALLYFLVSYIPGGSGVLTLVLKTAVQFCRNMCGFKDKGSYLPT